MTARFALLVVKCNFFFGKEIGIFVKLPHNQFTARVTLDLAFGTADKYRAGRLHCAEQYHVVCRTTVAETHYYVLVVEQISAALKHATPVRVVCFKRFVLFFFRHVLPIFARALPRIPRQNGVFYVHCFSFVNAVFAYRFGAIHQTSRTAADGRVLHCKVCSVAVTVHFNRRCRVV